MKKLAIITTHPIQYYAPVFALLAKEVDVKVFYTWDNRQTNYDPDFGKQVSWDIPLLEGYVYEFIPNTAKQPGSHHRNGIVNPSLNEAIQRFHPNAILIYGWNYESHWKVMREFKGKIPIWFRGDSTLLDEKLGIKSIFKSIYLRWVYRHIDKAFYVGTNNKAYFKRYGLKESQLVFAPHSIDNNRFAEDRTEEAQALRQSLGIEPQGKLVLFAGKLEWKKDPLLLLEAFIKLNKEQGTRNKEQRLKTNEIHLLFVGNGELEESLKSKVEGLKLKEENGKWEIRNGRWKMEDGDFNPPPTPSKGGQIHFMDFQNQTQMPVIYQACDLFCLPSKGPGETWGLAVNEAMAAGKAILVSDQVGCAVDLVSEVNGKIFKAGNLEDLKLKLEDLLNGNLLTLGANSRNLIQNWSFVQQVVIFSNLIHQGERSFQ